MFQRLTNRVLFAGVLLTSVASPVITTSEATAALSSSLTVTINGLDNQRGQVCVSVFSSSQGFPGSSDRAVQARCVKASGSPLQVTFDNLKSGNYAVAAFHDSNGDGTLNRNPLGIPTEEFGFSQNPRIVAGPPKFGESAVLVMGTKTEIQIQMRLLI